MNGTTPTNRRCAVLCVGVLAAALAFAPAALAKHAVTGTVSATAGSTLCTGYSAGGTASWSKGKVDQVLVSLGDQSQLLAASGKPSGTVSFSLSGATLASGATATVVVQFLDDGTVVATASQPLGTCTSPPPDLVITDIVFGTGPTSHGYTVTVQNVGSGPADLSGVPIQGYYSSTSTEWPGDVGAGGTSFNNGTTLAAGTSTTIVVGNSATPDTSAYPYLVVQVNFDTHIAESDTTNNVYGELIPAGF